MTKKKNKLPSRFQIGDEVLYKNEIVKVAAVQFTESHVYYGIRIGDNKPIGLVGSLDVSPVEKQESK